MMAVSPVRLIVTLASLGASCALVLSTVSWATAARIESNQAAYLRKSVLSVVPGAVAETPMDIADATIFAAHDGQGDLVGYAIVSAAQGFQDTITLVYGYDPYSETLTGFRVLASRETPGLGDKIEKDAHFQANFEGLEVMVRDGVLQHDLVMVKPLSRSHGWEVDAISGATISSRAVTVAVGESARQWLPILKARSTDEH